MQAGRGGPGVWYDGLSRARTRQHAAKRRAGAMGQRRERRAVLVVLVAGLLVLACAPPRAAPAPAAASGPAAGAATAPAPEAPRRSARVAYPSPSLSYFPLFFGWKEGLFAAEGLDLEF